MLISDWSSDVCSSDLHICDDRSGFSLAHRQPVFGAGASDTSLDPVKAGDPPQRLLGNRGIATFGVVKEATPDVRPAEGERSRRSEEHTSELQSLMRISYAVFCLKKKKQHRRTKT